MRIAVAADERTGVAEEVSAELRRFAAEPSAPDDDRANVAHVAEIEARR